MVKFDRNHRYKLSDFNQPNMPHLVEFRKRLTDDVLCEINEMIAEFNRPFLLSIHYLKLLYPDGEFTKEELEEILKLSLEMRRRVKEQLKKLGGMEFNDVNFSYIDLEDMSERYVSVPEQGGGKLIPEAYAIWVRFMPFPGESLA